MGILDEKNITLVIDFDSTIVKTETLEVLADYVLDNDPRRTEIFANIAEITRKGMEGLLPFSDSLSSRLQLFRAHREDVEHIAEETVKEISDSLLKHESFIKQNSDRIHVISGGFKEIILPTTQYLGIDDAHVHANDFVYDQNDFVVGADGTNALAQENGKVRLVESLKLPGCVWVVGDGYTDYAIKESGAADKFFAYVENTFRESVVAHADAVLSEFDDLLVHLQSAK